MIIFHVSYIRAVIILSIYMICFIGNTIKTWIQATTYRSPDKTYSTINQVSHAARGHLKIL